MRSIAVAGAALIAVLQLGCGEESATSTDPAAERSPREIVAAAIEIPEGAAAAAADGGPTAREIETRLEENVAKALNKAGVPADEATQEQFLAALDEANPQTSEQVQQDVQAAGVSFAPIIEWLEQLKLRILLEQFDEGINPGGGGYCEEESAKCEEKRGAGGTGSGPAVVIGFGETSSDAAPLNEGTRPDEEPATEAIPEDSATEAIPGDSVDVETAEDGTPAPDQPPPAGNPPPASEPPSQGEPSSP